MSSPEILRPENTPVGVTALVRVVKPVIVVARPHPLSMEKVSAHFEHGLSVAQIVGDAAVNCAIEIGGIPIPEFMWRHVRPKPGTIVFVTRYPQGGGGGGWKMILRLVAFAALAVVTYGIATGVAWLPEAIQALSQGAAAGLAAVVGIGGSLLINALIPPAATGVGQQTSPTSLQSISGVQNSMDPYGAVTCVFGTMLLYPKLAARSYSEYSGDDQYVFALFDLGYGELTTTAMKLGTDDLADFTGVTTEIGSQPALFPYDVLETAAGNSLNEDDDTATHATGENADEGSIDLIFQNGLLGADSSGSNITATCKLKIEINLARTSVSPISGIVAIQLLNPGRYDGPITAEIEITGDGVGAQAVAICNPVGVKTPGTQYAPPTFYYGVTAIVITNSGHDYTYAAALINVSGGAPDPTAVSIGVPQIATVTDDGVWSNALTLAGMRITNPDATFDGTYLVCASSERKPFRVGVYWQFAQRGFYKIKVTRISTTWGTAPENNRSGDLTWTVVRTIRYTPPSITPTTKLAMRIKASDQLNGSVSNFNLVESQIIPVWDGTDWVNQATSNPAWIYRWVLRDCPANPRRVSPSRINDEDLKEWGAECDTKGYVFNYINDQVTTVFELLKIICACGRASFTVVDSKYSVVRDVAQTVPVQIFTPRNTLSFQGTRAFVDVVHALRVQFINPQAGYQQDELIVYDDGYDARNASKFEQLQFPGCADAVMAWKLGRYHLAVARLRANMYTFSTDIEHLICNRGDLVLFASDVISVGLGWGRVKGITADADGNVLSVKVDEPQTVTDMTKIYVMRFRKQNGSAVTSVVTFQPDNAVCEFALTTPTPGINPGDLFIFGIQGQDSIPMLINKIEPTADMAAKLTAVDASPAVLEADAGYIDSTGTYTAGIPPLISSITGQPWNIS